MDELDYDSIRMELITGRYDTITALLNKNSYDNQGDELYRGLHQYWMEVSRK